MATRATPSIGVSINVSGTLKRLRHVRLALPRNLRKVTRATGDRMAIRARELVPVDTGLLYSTIRSRHTEAGAILTAGEPNPNPPDFDSIPRRKRFKPLAPNTPAPYAGKQERIHGYLQTAYAEHLEDLDASKSKYVKKVVAEVMAGRGA